MQQHGTPLTAEIVEMLWQRIVSRSERIGECLIWNGGTTKAGYGRVCHARRLYYNHRISYLWAHGDIPDGLTIDHVKNRGCVSRACSEPIHLEAVTNRVNILRGTGFSARNITKTHCPRWHQLIGDNLDKYALSIGQRMCRICKNRWMRDQAVLQAAQRHA